MNNLLESLGAIIDSNFWIAPIMSLVAGALTSFAPCGLSSIPLVIGYVGGVDSRNVKKAFRLSLVFASGNVIAYTTLGIIAALFGKIIRFTGNWWYLILAGILIIMVLQLWEIINILPRSNLLSKNKKRGYLGAFLAGILSGLFSSPCATPVLIVLLAIVGTKGSLLFGIVLLLLYSIGHSVLIVMAGTSIGFVNKLNDSNKYHTFTHIIKIILGIIILLLAFRMFYLGI